MDTLPLPGAPRLEEYRERAERLAVASRSADANAVREWANDWMQSLESQVDDALTPFVRQSIGRAVDHMERRAQESRARGNTSTDTALTDTALTDTALTDTALTLAAAQQLIARGHGFDSWEAFAHHVEQLGANGRGSDFERGADAVVTGDMETLRALIRKHPGIVHERSERVHHATLLHYVAANGVEDFRQKTPPNAVGVAELLLRAGAKPDALADTYGRDYFQTPMNLLVSSVHPASAGLQSRLVETLLDHGAAIDGVTDDESPLFTALDFGYVDAAETLARRGARVDNIVSAAALGDIEVVRRSVVDAVTLRSEVPLVAPPWHNLDASAKAHIELALVWACRFGRAGVAEHLVRVGVDPASKDSNAMTALHWAAATGLMSVVDALLQRGALLEALNAWEGTVLGSTLHFALHDAVPGVDYVRMVKRLLAAGANVDAISFPTGLEQIDRVLREHGARAS